MLLLQVRATESFPGGPDLMLILIDRRNRIIQTQPHKTDRIDLIDRPEKKVVGVIETVSRKGTEGRIVVRSEVFDPCLLDLLAECYLLKGIGGRSRTGYRVGNDRLKGPP